MDELDIFKEQWKKDSSKLPNFRAEEIYPMLHKRSASIVKWIFYISIGELAFWLLIEIGMRLTGYKPELNIPQAESVQWGLYIVGYPVILWFIYRFWKNYKTIDSTDSVKGLMQSIINSRRAVKQYVAFNLIFFFVGSIVLWSLMFAYDPELSQMMNGDKSTLFIVMFIIVTIIFLGICALAIWLFYRLIYGILLKRLRKNYRELEKME